MTWPDNSLFKTHFLSISPWLLTHFPGETSQTPKGMGKDTDLICKKGGDRALPRTIQSPCGQGGQRALVGAPHMAMRL